MVKAPVQQLLRQRTLPPLDGSFLDQPAAQHRGAQELGRQHGQLTLLSRWEKPLLQRNSVETTVSDFQIDTEGGGRPTDQQCPSTMAERDPTAASRQVRWRTRRTVQRHLRWR